MGRDLDPLGKNPDTTVLEDKTPSKAADPCRKASKLSMKCLEDNNYNKARCTLAFQNYRDCKKAWIESRRKGTSA